VKKVKLESEILHEDLKIFVQFLPNGCTPNTKISWSFSTNLGQNSMNFAAIVA